MIKLRDCLVLKTVEAACCSGGAWQKTLEDGHEGQTETNRTQETRKIRS